MGKFACLEVSALTKTWSTEERAGLAHFLKARELTPEDTLRDLNGLLFIDNGEIEVTIAGHTRLLGQGQIVGLFNLFKKSSTNASFAVLKPGLSWQLKAEDWYELKAISPSIALQILEDALLYFRAESQTHAAMTAASLFL